MQRATIAAALLVCSGWTAAQTVDNHFRSPHVNFEGGEAAPIVLSTIDPLNHRLFVLNQPDNRLEVFVDGPNADGILLTHEKSIFTGLEPSAIALDPGDANTVYVSNWISDTVSVVDVAGGYVRRTLQCGDEPREMVVVDDATLGHRLYVAVARAEDPAGSVSITTGPMADPGVVPGPYIENAVSVFDLDDSSSTPAAVIAIDAVQPRSLVRFASSILVIPETSSNETTIAEQPVNGDAELLFQGIGFLQHQPDVIPGVLDCPDCPTTFPSGWNPLFYLLDFVAYPAGPGLTVNNINLGWRTPVTGRIVTESEFGNIDPPGFEGPSSLDLPDKDVIAISMSGGPGNITDTVGGVRRNIGTTLYDAQVTPAGDEIWVAATDANNRIRFEPELKGKAHDNIVTRVSLISSQPGGGWPRTDFRDIDGMGTNHALPVDIAFTDTATGFAAYVAMLGSDAVIVLDENGDFDMELSTGSMPRGLAVPPSGTGRILYVFCRGDMTVEAFDVDAGHTPAGTAALPYDPEPTFVREGRQTMYGATGARGNGTTSCASCHVDGEWDGLAWDLGNPGGSLAYPFPDLSGQTMAGLADNNVASPPIDTPLAEIPPHPMGVSHVQPFGPLPTTVDEYQALHPMKGPLSTQLLKGMAGTGSRGQSKSDEPFHWRGDRRFLHQFQGAFVGLQGAAAPGVSDDEMQTFVAFMRNMVIGPNPYQPRDRTYRDVELTSGSIVTDFDAETGRVHYGLDATGTPYNGTQLLCVSCHRGSFDGTGPAGFDYTGGQRAVNNDFVQQQFNPPPLRKIYEKNFPGLTGFGTGREGSNGSILGFLTERFVGATAPGGPFVFFNDNANGDDIRQDVADFVQAWDSGIHPAVGRQLTVDQANFTATSSSWTTFENTFVVPGVTALIGKGRIPLGAGMQSVGIVYIPGATPPYATTASGTAVDRTFLEQKIQLGGGSITWTIVPAELALRLGIDRDEDGLRDGLDGDDVTPQVAGTPGAPAATIQPILDVWVDRATIIVTSNELVRVNSLTLTPVGGGALVTPPTSLDYATRHDLMPNGLAAGTEYDVSIVVEDLDGTTATVTSSVTTAIRHVHVQDLTLTLDTLGRLTVNATVHDQSEAPVAGIRVRGVALLWHDATPVPNMLAFANGDLAIEWDGVTGANGKVRGRFSTGGAIPIGPAGDPNQVTFAVTFLGSSGVDTMAADTAGVLFNAVDSTAPGGFSLPAQFYEDSRNDVSFVTKDANDVSVTVP